MLFEFFAWVKSSPNLSIYLNKCKKYDRNLINGRMMLFTCFNACTLCVKSFILLKNYIDVCVRYFVAWKIHILYLISSRRHLCHLPGFMYKMCPLSDQQSCSADQFSFVAPAPEPLWKINLLGVQILRGFKRGFP